MKNLGECRTENRNVTVLGGVRTYPPDVFSMTGEISAFAGSYGKTLLSITSLSTIDDIHRMRVQTISSEVYFSTIRTARTRVETDLHSFDCTFLGEECVVWSMVLSRAIDYLLGIYLVIYAGLIASDVTTRLKAVLYPTSNPSRLSLLAAAEGRVRIWPLMLPRASW